MPEKKAQTARAKVRQEARAAADQIERSFLPEGSAPLPLAIGMHVGGDALKHWMKTGQDMTRFYNGRMAKDVGFMTEFALCRSPADVANIWYRAASETAHDYANQFDRILALNLNGSEALTNGADK